MNKYFGVNLSGAEFDGGNPAQNVPGVFNKDFTYPVDSNEHKYYVGKGLTLFRFPLRWERIQRTLLGPLSDTDVAEIKTVLDTAQSAGAKVILEIHNYGQYQTGTANNQPTLTPVTIANKQNLIDVWQKLVTQFKDHPAIFGYELMNEPHDLPDGATGWVTICQAVADAIGAIDTQHYIIIPGYDWQSADRWQTSSGNLLIKGTNIIYSAHCYFDGDASGGYWWGTVDNANGTGRVQHFIDWLKANNAQGIITEYGVPFGPTATTPLKAEWYPVLQDFLNTLNTSDQILGGTAWAAGPWWGNYNLTIEPYDAPSAFTKDRESMAIYEKFPSTNASSPTSPTTPTTPTQPPATTPPSTTPPSTSGTTSGTTGTPPSSVTITPTPLDVTTLNELLVDVLAIVKKIRQLLHV